MSSGILFEFFVAFKNVADAEMFEAYFPVTYFPLTDDSAEREDGLGLVADGWPESEAWDNAVRVRNGAFVHAVGEYRGIELMDLLSGKKRNELTGLTKRTRLLALRMLGEDNSGGWYCAVDGKVAKPLDALEHAIAIKLVPSWIMSLATLMNGSASAVKKALAAGIDPNVVLHSPLAELQPQIKWPRRRALDDAAELMVSGYPEQLQAGRDTVVALLAAGADPTTISKHIKKTRELKTLLEDHGGNAKKPAAGKKVVVKQAPATKANKPATKKSATMVPARKR